MRLQLPSPDSDTSNQHVERVPGAMRGAPDVSAAAGAFADG
ncbi:conserved hypothetical protein [Burkholderia pseudomallei MSHR346]|nr:hypothetical protein BURPS668_0078 [Burkholderia pseudomallei 668]ACQ97760.1 conserved hypothetical protein [Burkholderia pseudomallei MSHR346]